MLTKILKISVRNLVNLDLILNFNKTMKKKHILLGLIVFLLAQLNSFAAYELVWSDEFNGNSLNQTVWSIEVNGDGGGNGESQYYTNKEDNLFVRDGNLHIVAKREDYNGKAYTSGRINSKGKVSARYGRMEARIKLPAGAQGQFPAFWMMGQNIDAVGWPRCGEIDIMEQMCNNNVTSYRRTMSTLHWNANGSYAGAAYSPADYGQNIVLNEELGARYRIYGIEWVPARGNNPPKIIGYYSDNADGNCDANNRVEYFWINLDGAGMDCFTAQEHYFLLNFAVGAWFIEGGIDPNFGSREMLVDWVRIYQDQATYDESTLTDKSIANGQIPSINNYNYILIERDTNLPANYLDLRYYTGNADLNVWGNQWTPSTLFPIGGTAYEGNHLASFTDSGAGWYGLAYANTVPYDFAALNNYRLHMRLNVSNTTNTRISVGGNERTLQQLGVNPVANQWMEIDVPVTNFGVTITEPYANLVVVLGETGSVLVDDVYFYKNGQAKLNPGPSTGGNEDTSVHLSNYNYIILNRDTNLPANNTYDMRGDVNIYAWENKVTGTGLPSTAEGDGCINFAVNANDWYGYGVHADKGTIFDYSGLGTYTLHFK